MEKMHYVVLINTGDDQWDNYPDVQYFDTVEETVNFLKTIPTIWSEEEITTEQVEDLRNGRLITDEDDVSWEAFRSDYKHGWY